MHKIINRVRCIYIPTYVLVPTVVYLDAVDACDSLMNAPWGWKFDGSNIYRGYKYILLC
jgi:hypothetical protein